MPKARKVVGVGYTPIKVHKHTTINLMTPEKMNEVVQELPVGISHTINITEHPILDGCTIRATVVNKKVVGYSLWYDGSTTYEPNPKYDASDENLPPDVSPLVLNKNLQEEATEMYRFNSLQKALDAIAEFAPDW